MNFAETADHYAPRTEDIVGPYSPWPRRRSWRGGRALAFASGLAALGVIAHAGLPLGF
jgi:hypothetical protein